MRPELGYPHGAAWRGALWITLIALLTTGVALTLQYVQTSRLLEQRMHALVDDEATSLVDRYRTAGVEGVAAAIGRQQQLPRISEFFYLLAWPDGTPIAGNLVGWPADVTESGFHSFSTEVTNTRGTTSRRWVEARAVVLDGGIRLLVGNFADERAMLKERYLWALAWSLAATGILGLLLGWWHSRRGLAFVDAAADAGQRFLAGRLEERLPVSRRGDEYDRLAETINRCFAEVERLVGSLRAATDGLAHDLKTPLTRIRARLELAALERELDGPAARVVQESREDLDTLLQLIDDTLDLARAEATAASQFVPLALEAIVRETIELYQPVAEDKAVAISAEIAPATVLGSRTLIARLVVNLIDNAVKYAPHGGEVRVSLVPSGRTVRLIVADNGEGIAAADRSRMLQRFERGDTSRSTRGSGLGLSIVDVVARVHNGRVALADNAPGLRVEVDLPAAPPSPPEDIRD